MGHITPIELIKITKIVTEIREFPAKINSQEQATKARELLKKYALLSEKIERNVLINTSHQKELAKIRTDEFKAIRRALKENANLILNPQGKKNASGEKTAKKTAKSLAPKKTTKTTKATEASATKKTATKKSVNTSSSKTTKKAVPKEKS